jgi:hypothetical protein
VLELKWAETNKHGLGRLKGNLCISLDSDAQADVAHSSFLTAFISLTTMATVARYIYSHYDPADKPAHTDSLEAGAEDVEHLWETEKAFGSSDRLRGAPRFVPAASASTSSWNSSTVEDAEARTYRQNSTTADVAGWYRSLPRTPVAMSYESSQPVASASAPSFRDAERTTTRGSHSQNQSGKMTASKKNDWFNSRVLANELPPVAASSDSLANILARAPPPEPTEAPFRPPVFLALGPANKGFSMLERQGWTEGEALGPTVVRRLDSREVDAPEARPNRSNPAIKMEEVVTVLDDDVSEVRRMEIVDLTLSDDDEEQSEFEEDPYADILSAPASISTPAVGASDNATHTALITPLPTVLKADRLGIGLKAKTEGPYRISKKRVTHGAAALAAHIRAGEKTRRIKKQFGRGQRGFGLVSKQATAERQNLLQYLNS